MCKKLKVDCKYFKGYMPCRFQKSEDLSCPCKHYTKRGKRVLIIKLAAMGDVIRTTPLLRKLKNVFSNCEITWITRYPEIIPKMVDIILEYNLNSILMLVADEFDILYNLDKDKDACALANLIRAKTKKGFILKEGKVFPIDKDAEQKFLTGIDDNLNRRNKLSYVEEIFQIVSLPYSGEKYVLDKPKVNLNLPKLKSPVIGLNTGCGHRWESRLWKEKNWISLAKKLKEERYSVIILGGELEDLKNKEIAKKSGANYFGHFPLKRFISLVDKCDSIVTSVTLTLHIAIGLGKKIVLFNNVFNKNEFELYGLGKIIEPNVNCLGCYQNKCSKKCMERIKPQQVLDDVKKLLPI